MYSIEVTYTTGNSFHSEEETTQIGLVWTNKELARKALKSLREHYELYYDQESYSSRNNIQDIRNKALITEWYKKGIESEKNKHYFNDPSYWHFYCGVEMDDGSWRNLPTTIWCGYFQQLHNARIVVESSDEDEVNF